MKTVEIIFSPTGGTAAAADALMSSWPGDPQVVDLSRPALDFSGTVIDPDDLVLIAVPSFGGRAPGVAMTRLSEIRGNGASCALLCVYGNRAYEDTLVELADTAESCGFRIIGAAVAVAEHSVVRDIAAGRPDDKDTRELASFGREILEKAQSGASSIIASVPGNRPFKKNSLAPMTPKAGRSCTECGTCAENCPTGAIDPRQIRKAQTAQCISCMRCVSICPQNARSINSALRSLVALALKKQTAERRKNELYL